MTFAPYSTLPDAAHPLGVGSATTYSKQECSTSNSNVDGIINIAVFLAESGREDPKGKTNNLYIILLIFYLEI